VDNLYIEHCGGEAAGAAVADEEIFARWLEQATENDAASMSIVGDCLAEGVGVEACPEHAVFWWRCGAELGCPESMIRLAAAYESGFGVPVNIDATIAWLRSAAQHHDPQAMAFYGAALANYRWDEEASQIEVLRIARHLVDLGIQGAREAIKPVLANASASAVSAALSDPVKPTLN